MYLGRFKKFTSFVLIYVTFLNVLIDHGLVLVYKYITFIIHNHAQVFSPSTCSNPLIFIPF